MKKYIALLLLLPLAALAVTNTYKQPNAAIFYKTLTLPALGSTVGVVTTSSTGLLSSTAYPIILGSVSPLNTKGDLLSYSTSNVRFPVGTTTGTFLQVDPGSTVGYSWDAIIPSQVPTLNQNTTGTASNVTGVVALINGGTGTAAGSSIAALNAISPLATKGDFLTYNSSGNVRMPIGQTTGYVPTVDPGATTGWSWQIGSGGGGFNSPLNTKGDLLSYSTSNVRFPVGTTTGTFLQVDPGSTVGYSWDAIIPSQIPTLNQNTTGTASNVTGIVALTNGGTGLNSGSTTGLFNALSPLNAKGDMHGVSNAGGNVRYPIGSTTGTFMVVDPGSTVGYSWAAIIPSQVPTLNQTTTGNAANVTGIVALTNGGTGLNAGSTTGLFNSLSPLNKNGDILGVSNAGGNVRLPIGATVGWSLNVDPGTTVGFSWGPITNLAGNLAIGHGGTGISAGSTVAVLNAISPLAFKGDLLTYNSSGNVRVPVGATTAYYLGVDPGSTTGISWQAAGNVVSVGATYWTGYHANGNNWSVTSTTFADMTSGGTTPAITTVASNNLTVTTAASSLPGITFTPASSSAVYFISASFSWLGGATGTQPSFSLTDGTTIISQGDFNNVSSGTMAVGTTLVGIYAPATGSAVTVKIQAAANSNTAQIFPGTGGTPRSSIEWSVVQVNPPPIGITALANGGTGINAGSTTGLFNSLSPVIAKGDLLGFSTQDVRLPIGATVGVPLVVDPGSTVGFSWAPVPSARYTTTTQALVAGASSLVNFTSNSYDAFTMQQTGGWYKIPVAGKYLIEAGASVTGTWALNKGATLAIYQNTAQVSVDTEYAAAAVTELHNNVHDIISCAAGDDVGLYYTSTATSPVFGSGNSNYFSIIKVGN